MSRTLLVLAVVALFAGIALIWIPGPTRRVVARPSDGRPLAFGALVAAATFALTGWVLPAVVVGSGAGRLVRSRSTQRRTGAGVESVEALAAWIENVRDVLRAGAQPLGAIAATVDSCPDPVRPHVRALSARLASGQDAETALRRFADDLDDPLGDLVAVGLLVAITRGAQTEAALSALAAQTRHHAERRRLVDAERAPVQREVQMVTAVMCLLLAGVLAFGRSEYLAAYDTVAGQVVFAAILVGYVAMVSWAIRLTRFRRPQRFLTLGGAT